MTIVPNLNGVQISQNTPLFDPRNRSTRSRLTQDDEYKTTQEITLLTGNQLVIGADQVRNCLMFLLSDVAAAPVYISTIPLVSAAGVPVYPGNGWEVKGKSSELAYYCYGVAGQVLTLMYG